MRFTLITVLTAVAVVAAAQLPANRHAAMKPIKPLPRDNKHVVPVHQTTPRTVIKTVTKPVAKLVSKPLVNPVSKHLSQPLSKSRKEPVEPLVKQPLKPVVKQPLKPVVKQPLKPVVKQPFKPVVNQPHKVVKPVGTDPNIEAAKANYRLRKLSRSNGKASTTNLSGHTAASSSALKDNAKTPAGKVIGGSGATTEGIAGSTTKGNVTGGSNTQGGTKGGPVRKVKLRGGTIMKKEGDKKEPVPDGESPCIDGLTGRYLKLCLANSKTFCPLFPHKCKHWED